MIVLTVLDFNDGLVYQYDIDIAPNSEADRLNRLKSLDFERIIVEKGHSIENCEWMSHADDTLIKETIEL
jgi:hypothetical protein